MATHPLVLTPTDKLVQVFDPFRPKSWRRPGAIQIPVPAPMPIERLPVVSAPQQAPPPTVSPPHVVKQPMASSVQASSSNFMPLAPQHVRAIQTVLRERGGESTGFGRLFASVTTTTLDPRQVTMHWLHEQHVTVHDLVVGAKIPISDLFASGIVRSYTDLVTLGFRVSDLTANRERFTCNHAALMFSLTFDFLRTRSECGGFTILTLVETRPPFTCDELLTLQVSARGLFALPDGQLDPELEPALMGAVGLTLDDWARLDLTADVLQEFGVTATMARRQLRWDPKAVAHLLDMPTGWLST